MPKSVFAKAKLTFRECLVIDLVVEGQALEERGKGVGHSVRPEFEGALRQQPASWWSSLRRAMPGAVQTSNVGGNRLTCRWLTVHLPETCWWLVSGKGFRWVEEPSVFLGYTAKKKSFQAKDLLADLMLFICLGPVDVSVLMNFNGLRRSASESNSLLNEMISSQLWRKKPVGFSTHPKPSPLTNRDEPKFCHLTTFKSSSGSILTL